MEMALAGAGWLLVLGALTFAACGDDDDDGTDTAPQGQAQQFPAGSTTAEIQDNGEVVIGVKFDVPPFGFVNPQSGDVEGFDVDLGQAIADELGRRGEVRSRRSPTTASRSSRTAPST